MSGSARLRDSPRSGLIAAALCVLATAAVLITAPAVHSALRSGASGRQPLAPRLAALSDQELAQLLPKQRERIPGLVDRRRDHGALGHVRILQISRVR